LPEVVARGGKYGREHCWWGVKDAVVSAAGQWRESVKYWTLDLDGERRMFIMSATCIAVHVMLISDETLSQPMMSRPMMRSFHVICFGENTASN
jgi:hypothetical protein